MARGDNVEQLIERIYGHETGRCALNKISAVMRSASLPPAQPAAFFNASDVMLITYGDSLQRTGQKPLQTLFDVTHRYFKDVFSAIHFLPFFPFSSDDGFSVIDYHAIDSQLGSWDDVVRFADRFDLMFDFVLNHVSARSRWFARYLSEEPGFEHLAIEVPPDTDLSTVTRPRTLPLLTPFVKSSGQKVHLWTTFSDDQVDLNFECPDVLALMIEVMLFYVAKGARMLRLDAVAYLWKQIGTACIHLPQTYDVIRLLRAVLDQVAPHVMMVTETNVPHLENISYFGNGFDQAQMVYNFTLPPLLLHTLITGDATAFNRWAATLATPSDRTTFFNFTASHDGIGVRPVEGILSSDQIQHLIDTIYRNGGEVSYKTDSDGSKSPYEMNITYLDALGQGGRADKNGHHVARFLASQAIALAMPGVPGIYIHSILGSRNWQEGVRRTGRARTINREKLDADDVVAQLEDRSSLRAKVFWDYSRMIRIRRRQPAFDPNAAARILDLDRRLVAIERRCNGQRLVAVTNVTDEVVRLDLRKALGESSLTDLLATSTVSAGLLALTAYQSAWLTAGENGTGIRMPR